MKNLSQISGMPQIRAALNGWMKSITLTKRTQVITAGLVSYNDIEYTFQGSIQPLSPRQISLKPEGQRAWTWLQIHALTSIENLTTNDQIIYNGTIYKVMAIKDYGLNNYVEYHCCEEYQP